MIPGAAFAAPGAGQEWVLTDLTSIPELAAFFGNSDAVITTKPAPNDESIRPTVFAFKLQTKAKGKLKTASEWQAFLKPQIKDTKRVILNQDASQSGRFIMEFTSRNKDSDSDLQSLYLAIQSPDNSVSLFVYDGVGPTTAKNMPIVKKFFSTLDKARLMDLYRADVERRKALKIPGQAP